MLTSIKTSQLKLYSYFNKFNQAIAYIMAIIFDFI